jgi:zinc finger FYVE domain-containing protein 26
MTPIGDFKASSSDSHSHGKSQRGSTLNMGNNNNVSSMNDAKSELVYWKLLGNAENETSQKNDDDVRHLFRFQQAPSTSLCLSILDLHDQPLECGKSLLDMCDDLSNYLQAKSYQSEDISMIINMIKYLLQNAKIKLLQNSSSTMISLCDTYLSLIDILEQLLLANVSNLPSLYDLRNPESVRRVRNRLLEEERYELAMNLSTKFGLDTQSVWASWGLVELKRANYKEARTKFDKCLKQVNEKSQSSSISSTQVKILNDILTHLESALPNRMIGVIDSICTFFYFQIK